MRIGILSDTHDQVVRTRTAVAALVDRGAEVLIHCGDLTIAEVVYECARLPCYFVFGNCDDDHESLESAMKESGGTCLDRGGVLTLAGRQIAVTHGHSLQELRRLAHLEPHYLCSGHTHRVSDEQKGTTRWLNPGALYRASIWTVMLLDIAINHAILLTINDARMRD
jgi:putative phosphoesterase